MSSRQFIRRFLLFHALSVCFVLAGAQRLANGVLVENITVADGLSQNTVRNIAVDCQGFLWFGTNVGFDRYDGSRFLVYGSQDGYENVDFFKQVETIKVDGGGLIWCFNTDGSVSCFDPHRERQIDVRDKYDNQLTLSGARLLSLPDSTSLFYGPEGAFYFRYVEKYGLTCLWQDSLAYTAAHIYNNELWLCGEELVRVDPDGGETRLGVRGLNYVSHDCDIVDDKALIVDRTNVLHCVDMILHKSLDDIVLDNVRYSLVEVCSLSDSLIALRCADGKMLLYDVVSGCQQPLSAYGFDGLEDKSVDFVFDDDGRLWIYDNEGVLFYYSRRTGKGSSVRLMSVAEANIVGETHVSVVQDNTEKGVYWISSYGGGLTLLDENEGLSSVIEQSVGFVPQYVLCMVQDANGILWLGSEGMGVCKVLRRRYLSRMFRVSPDSRGKATFSVKTVYEASDGKVWAGTQGGGLFVFDSEGRQRLFQRKDIRPRAIQADRFGRIWVGTQGEGVYVFDAKSYRELAHLTHDPSDRNSLSSNDVYNLLLDNAGRLWVGTQGGALELVIEGAVSSTRFRHFLEAGKDRECHIRDIFQDSEGYLWVATSNDGLFSFLPEQLIKDPNYYVAYPYDMSNARGLSTREVQSICEDHNHQIWMGTAGGGLLKLVLDVEGVRYQKYTTLNGLPSDVINSLVCVDDSSLWIGTENGLSCLNIYANTFTNLYEVGNKFGNLFNTHACSRRTDGHVLFGTIDGIVDFDPIPHGTRLPPKKPTITEIYVNGERIVYDPQSDRIDAAPTFAKVISIGRTDQHLIVNFSLLNYDRGENDVIVYQIKGQDKEWLIPQKKNSIIVNYLSPGFYVLRLKNINGTEKDVRELAIVVSETIWTSAILVYVYMVVLIIVFFVVFYHIYRVTEKKARVIADKSISESKRKLFNSVDGQLRLPIKVSEGSAALLYKDADMLPETLRPHLFIVNDNMRKLSAFIDALLDYNRADEKMMLYIESTIVMSFLNEVFMCFTDQADFNNIKYTLNVKGGWRADFDRDKVEKILRCLLSNSFRNTPAGGMITLSAHSNEDNDCIISVCDNGLGVSDEMKMMLAGGFFDRSDNDLEIALTTAYRLTRTHHGTLSFVANLDGGATFTLTLPSEYKETVNVEYRNMQRYSSNSEGISTSILDHCMQTDDHVMTESFTTTQPLAMIIDDRVTVRDFYAERLMSYFRVMTISDGHIAISRLQTLTPDIIICDGHVSGMAGADIVRHIRSNFNQSFIPVVMTITNPEGLNDISLDNMGPDVILTKPVGCVELIKKVRTLIDRSFNIRIDFNNNFGAIVDLNESDLAFLQRFAQQIRANYMRDNFRVNELAALMNLPANEIHRRLFRLVGVYPGEYVRYWRIVQARKLLIGGGGPSQQVMRSVGFSDYNYFNKCLVRHYGRSAANMPFMSI